MQQGYLPSRNTLISSIFNEANNDNAGATMVWEWIAWQISDPSYDFSVGQDGSNAIYAQIAYMNSKVCCCAWAAHICIAAVIWMSQSGHNQVHRCQQCICHLIACTL